MIVTGSLGQLRATVDRWQANGERIGLVPTMGNLHAGHLALLEELERHCDRTVVSIFVNPTQFGPGEDFEAYPRTRDEDLDQLQRAGCDLAWLPDQATMYPLADPFMVQAPAPLAEPLCGRRRAGHFDGVATVVLRLFNQVRPEVSVFGEKDYQQLLIIRRLVEDLSLPIEVRGLPTIREADGLAMSSRNRYLSEDERGRAPKLHETLVELAGQLRAGSDWPTIEARARSKLESEGIEVEYLEWRSAEDLGPPRPNRPQRLWIAARLGRARLIDNVPV
ncbi:MAG: pantoate--beta-alanine ligase [Wenzhouxiangella sp.]|jgi:pantoate--beta-alanine ligase|nr:pantoate--beta-alanine ligase [Wenzhouxiangella sp.]